MAQQKHADFDQYYLIEDSKVRESFQQIYTNSRDLQAQIDKLVELINSANTFADLKTAVNTEFS